MKRIAIVTCRPMPHEDLDEVLLLERLRAAGAQAELAAWNDDAVKWADFDVAVIRSTWDYYHQLDAFLAWAARASQTTTLRNMLTTLRWNTDKAYLTKLGVPVVPTVLIDRGVDCDLARISREHAWSRIVVKPRVSAGSFRTQVLDVASLTEHAVYDRDMLVQPYVPSVEGYGERSIVWIDGAITHAIRKSRRFVGDPESTTLVPVADDERRFAESLIAHVPEPLLYARCDLARDDEGKPMLMELELVEPSLFLRAHPPACDRLVGALLR